MLPSVGAYFRLDHLDAIAVPAAVPAALLDAAMAELLKARKANGERVARRALFVVFDRPGGGIARVDRGREFGGVGGRTGGRTGGRAGGAGESAWDGRHGGGGLRRSEWKSWGLGKWGREERRLGIGREGLGMYRWICGGEMLLLVVFCCGGVL